VRRLALIAVLAAIVGGGGIVLRLDEPGSAAAVGTDPVASAPLLAPVPDQAPMTADHLGIFTGAEMKSEASLPENVQKTLEELHGRGEKNIPVGPDGVQVVPIESGNPILTVYAVRFGDDSTPRDALCLMTFWNTPQWKAHPERPGGEGCFALPVGREFAMISLQDSDSDGMGEPFFGFGFVDPTRVKGLDVVLADGGRIPADVHEDGHFTVNAQDPSSILLDIKGYEVTLTDGSKVMSP
jgi:hypothetical protein